MDVGTRDATWILGAWVSALRPDDVPTRVAERLGLVLHDLLGVSAAGARLEESRAMIHAWRPAEGPMPIVGTPITASVEVAAWLNAVCGVSLELDEGNKYARGHPAVHGFPVVLALATQLAADGEATVTALLAAYEVAARFGEATTLHPGVHPHGTWGVPGAAAGCARLLGLGPDAAAAALDHAAGLAIAAPFDSATDGNAVRNSWLGAGQLSGLAAARAAAAGVATATGTAAHTIGRILGSFDPGRLTDRLGARWLITENYFKRHASCSFTHPPADAILRLRERHPWLSAADVASVRVETHHLAADLTSVEWPTRLAAMFSTPFVVATAIVHGRVDPGAGDDHARADPVLLDIARRVDVVVADDLDRRLPYERAARVHVLLRDGRTLTSAVSNPVGDVDHQPFGPDDVRAKVRRLVPPTLAESIEEFVAALSIAASLRDIVPRLNHPYPEEEGDR